MARQRDPKRDEAFEIWKQHNGEITNRKIAEQLGVLEKTISAWKSRDKWTSYLQSDDCSTTKKKRSTTKKEPAKKSRSPSDRQQKRSGNPRPSHKFPNHNSFRTKHGLYSKFLHAEQLEIIEATQDMEIPDYLWFHIQLTFSSIVRMQKIMSVDNAYGHLKEESGSSWGDGSGSESFSHVQNSLFQRCSRQINSYHITSYTLV